MACSVSITCLCYSYHLNHLDNSSFSFLGVLASFSKVALRGFCSKAGLGAIQDLAPIFHCLYLGFVGVIINSNKGLNCLKLYSCFPSPNLYRPVKGICKKAIPQDILGNKLSFPHSLSPLISFKSKGW